MGNSGGASKFTLGSEWQMPWRFAQNLRDLSCGGAARSDRLQLRWRTLCKMIKSRTLRRCGIPASSNLNSNDCDRLPGQYKFFFFEGTEELANAKRELIY